MIQVIEQTRDEKIAMYLKLTKRQLAEMLFNANSALDHAGRMLEACNPKPQYFHPFQPATWN